MPNPTLGTPEPRAGHDTLAYPRPVWLPDGCPSWCDYSDLHTDRDRHDVRLHVGQARDVQAVIEEPIDGQPRTIGAFMTQHYREADPQIFLGQDNTTNGLRITIEEARDLATHLLKLVTLAEAGK